MKAKISGIYIIKSNRDATKFYVGSATDVNLRAAVHRAALRSGNHVNGKLQNYYTRYGPASLSFELLEQCPPESLIKREQYYIDLLHPYFNINPIAGSRAGAIQPNSAKIRIGKAAKSKVSGKNREFQSGKFVKLGL